MIQRIDFEQIDKALAKFSIPPRPDMLKNIQSEVESEEPDLKKISALIDKDIGISSFTLKVVNSPLFSLSRKVQTIEHACMFLGLNRVCKLIQSIVLRFTLSEGDESAYSERIWNTANTIGIAAAVIAKEFELKKSLRDDCYTLGLFHNAGMALAHKLSPSYKKVVVKAYNQSNKTIAEIEEQELSMSHEVLGYLIANTWSLPDHLIEVIAYHHNHELMLHTGIKEEEQLFAVLKITEHLVGAPKLLGNAKTDHEWEKYGSQIMEILHIDESHLKHLGSALNKAGISSLYQ